MLPRYLLNFDFTHLKKSYSDFLVVDSSIVGLYTALKLLPQGEITILTKKALTESNTEYAQGGIAVALGNEDSPHFHLEDSLLRAGANFCGLQAFKVLFTEEPKCM